MVSRDHTIALQPGEQERNSVSKKKKKDSQYHKVKTNPLLKRMRKIFTIIPKYSFGDRREEEEGTEMKQKQKRTVGWLPVFLYW